MKKRTITFFTALALLFAGSVAANNINVSNIRVTGQNTTAGENNPANYTLVQFDLSWENSGEPPRHPTTGMPPGICEVPRGQRQLAACLA